MVSCIGEREREFIIDIRNNDLEKLEKKYSPSYRRVLKHRILQKRKTLTDDLLLINEVLDKLQSL
ncbi:MAG: hypothetical protein WA421_18350 [Nitrososphaeraceae archaeon]